VAAVLPPTVLRFLDQFTASTEYGHLRDEFRFVNAYRASWATAPYPPTFVTVDAVVIQGGYVLMVKRKFSPGKGLWALPGGFLGQDETAQAACVRELREETGIKVPVPVINGSITHQHLFDKPDRSTRGRTITQAFLVELTGGDTQLPKVKGSDDASDAKFFSLDIIDTMRSQIFEDHWDIINFMVGRSGK
jgi:bifunctional NMN adenylyltransferase/nudix hydrolase